MTNEADNQALGAAAVAAHTAAIGGGQETEDFLTQAIDTVTNIFHALNAAGFGEPHDRTRLIAICEMHFEAERTRAIAAPVLA